MENQSDVLTKDINPQHFHVSVKRGKIVLENLKCGAKITVDVNNTICGKVLDAIAQLKLFN